MKDDDTVRQIEPSSLAGPRSYSVVLIFLATFVAVGATLSVRFGIGDDALPPIASRAIAGSGAPLPSSTRPVPSTGLGAPLSLRGAGGVIVGMRRNEVERAWGVKLTPAWDPTLHCAPVARAGLQGFLVFVDGRLASVWFTAGPAVTDRRVGIGSTFEAVHAAYPAAVARRADKSVPGASTVVFRPNGVAGMGLRFDVSREGYVIRLAYGDHTLGLPDACG